MNQQPTFQISTLENIDAAIFEYIDEKLNIFSNTDEGFKKVPVLFSSPERSFFSKNMKDNREQNQAALKYPIISISQKNIRKPKAKEASLQGNVFSPNPFAQAIPVYIKINEEKTGDRANADSKRYAGTLNSKKIETKRTIYNIYKIPVPTFIEIDYSISIITNFKTQMNEILSIFIKSSRNANWFKLIRNGHGYECFYEENFNNESNTDDFTEQERKYEYNFVIKAKGYIHVGEENEIEPHIFKVENQPEIIFKGELIMSGEIP